ncbi:MAG: wax ester/triacylglycerol synthase family O-acyltransferase [Burkholderiales bacterium]
MQHDAGPGGLATEGAVGFMNGLDALFLYLESPETPMHVGSMHVFEPPAGGAAGFAAAVRAHIGARLDRADVFTRRLAPMPLGLANPAWVRAAEVDLDHHVRRMRLPEPGTLAQCHDLVGSLHARPLDTARPLWEMVVIEGLQDGRIGFYAKVHHAGLDGQAGVALAQAVYDMAARAAPPAPARAPASSVASTGHEPGAVRVAAAGARHNAAQLLGFGARLPGLLRAVAQAVVPALGRDDAASAVPGAPAGASGGAAALLGGEGLLAPRTALNASISRRRAFATLSVPMARARAIAQRHDASLNDVVLAACGGALRDWLLARGELPAESLLAAMPVSLRRAGDTSSNTQAMMARMTLATDVADPLARLHRIRDASGRIKGALREVKSAVPTEFPSLGLPWLGNALAAIWGRGRLANRLPPLANVIVSNVPGPAVPLYLLGARMLHYWPVSIPYHGVALNITVQSYVGSLDFGLIACRRAVPDVDAIAQRLVQAFDALDGDADRGAARPHAPPDRPARRRRAVPPGDDR